MITIWKYQLETIDKQWIEIPRGYKFLSVDTQYDIPCLWAQVDDQQPKDSILIITIGTGNPMRNKNMNFLGTYQLHDGRFIGHVFEAK